MSSGSPDGGQSARTVDAFLGGLVTLVQPRSGHRAGLDAALLQALVPADASGCVIDLGTGVGTAALAAAARVEGIQAIGVERESELIACAGAALEQPENAAFSGRVRFVLTDVTARGQARRDAGLEDASADWVLMNPPFDTPDRVRPSPDPQRVKAHVSPVGTLDDWARTAAGLLTPGGTLGLIHRAAALPEALSALARRFGDVRVRPVRAFEMQPAIRILISAVRGSRAELQLLPGLVLHRPDRTWTAAAQAILCGRAHIPM